MSTKDKLKDEAANDGKPLVSTRFFSIHGKKRKTPNEFTELGNAVDNFKMEVFKALKIPQIVEWLSKRLK
jgi:hypothetical protein